jgi:hypothetical protein
VDKFLARGGSRVYQIRFGVDDLDHVLATLGQRGVKVIRGREIAGQPKVGWVHPASAHGVLVELVQY